MADSGEKLSRSTILGLVAMGAGVLVIANDFVALSVALHRMEIELSTDVTTIQWVINSYALVFGVLIVTGGRLADMFGRRQSFFIGAVIFAAFSLLGGLAPDVYSLIAFRALMGIGGALMWPAILGMTYAIMPEEKAGLAGGVIIGVAGFGNAIGPLIGGVLTDTIGWRWVFFLNLPVTALAMLITWRVVPRDAPDGQDKRIDYGGIAVLSFGLLAVLLALDEGTDLGWGNPLIIALFVAAAGGLVGFVFVERAVKSYALVPADVLRNRVFAAASLATLLMSSVFFGALIYLPQFMEKTLGFSAIQAGFGFLPMMGVFAITSFIAGPLYSRLGAKLIVSAGALLLAVGMLLLSRLQTDTPYVGLVPGMVVLGAGVGLFYSSITTAAITALDKARASLGGAIIYMAQIAGGSVGIGLNTAIVVSAANLADGIGIAFLVNALLAACSLVVVVIFVGGKVDRERLKTLWHRHRAHG